MHSLRKWFYKPKKEDSSKLAQFYWADEELNLVAQELDSFDGRTDPDRCSLLVNQLRSCQDKVLTICNEIMDEVIPKMRANRDFRVKFPDDVLRENIVGQLWFGAECLAAGSNILNREAESAGMRPLAKALTRALDTVRSLLREQSLRNNPVYSDKIKESLKLFDKLFAEFELSYVSAMVPVKSSKEYHLQQEIIVLFSETLQRALQLSLVNQSQVDEFDPALMFAIPRLALVWGLLVYPEGPLNVDASPSGMSELFRPFHSLLYKIRDLLRTLTSEELGFLEKMLCSLEDPKAVAFPPSPGSGLAVGCGGQELCKQFVRDFYAFNFGDSREEEVEEEEEEETNNNLVAAESPVQVSDTVHTAQVEIEDVCSCQDEGVFSEEVATARTVLSHVMQRVEIVPPANIPTTAPLPCPLSLLASEPLGVPRRVQALRSPSISSTDTSPYDSDCPPDDAELALALQAAEIATCHQARARFRSAEELLHKLFVCIAGVADQLQTNFASDLRNILKCVFDMNSSVTPELIPPSPPGSTTTEEGERDSIDSAEEVLPDDSVSSPSPAEPPVWVPDTESDHCMACGAIFTLLRRRHHCRHCGRLFCARCSSNSIPLPRFGQHKPVRVCDECFRYQLTPFTVQQPC